MTRKRNLFGSRNRSTSRVPNQVPRSARTPYRLRAVVRNWPVVAVLLSGVYEDRPESVKRSKVYRFSCSLWYKVYAPHSNTRVTSSCRKLVTRPRVNYTQSDHATRVGQALETNFIFEVKFKTCSSNFQLQALCRNRLPRYDRHRVISV